MGEAQSATILEAHPCVENGDEAIASRVRTAKTRELLALPFDGIFHLSDEYELALVALHKKHLSFGQIRLLHFLVFAPLLELPSSRLPSLVGPLGLIKRLVMVGILLYGLFWGINAGLSSLGLAHLFPAVAAVTAVTLLAWHMVLALDSFQYWQNAYDHMDRAALKNLLRRRRHKVRKKAAEPVSSQTKLAEKAAAVATEAT